jgi:hypothetical protein
VLGTSHWQTTSIKLSTYPAATQSTHISSIDHVCKVEVKRGVIVILRCTIGNDNVLGEVYWINFILVV